MDRGGSVEAPRATAEDMAARRDDTRGYWENYLGFRADIEAERDAALRRIEQQGQYGTLPAAAVESAQASIRQDFESRLGELQQGPTYELLRSEFEAQQSFAREEDERAMRQYGTYEYREAGIRSGRTPAGGDEDLGGAAVEEGGWYRLQPSTRPYDEPDTWTRLEGEPPPRPEPTVFQGSMEDYYGEQFGEESVARGNVAGTSDAMRARARRGAGAGRAVGVGRVYPTY